ncbi:MAG: nicotinamide mononucleotide transporter [Clostridia bacterium]|nr:nicotinamide mononucleotide transporter [Clostridia bacterium]
MNNPFKDFTKFEWGLWILSLLAVGGSYLLAPSGDLLSLIASLIGVTALIFVAKGYVLGQVLTVVFAVFYGIISFFFRYYGEMITYLCMTAPIAVAAVISWVRHPYKESREVKVRHLKKREVFFLFLFATAATLVFYFILKILNTANLVVSTVSITTSVLACTLTVLRSPYYALAYAANDIVLIVLWVSASLTEPAYLPMVVCFLMFLLNDAYGYYNWCRMRRRQELN